MALSRSKLMAEGEEISLQECWKILGCAVVHQAIADWESNFEKLIDPKKATADNLRSVLDLESWLNSEMPEFYGVNGVLILHKLKKTEKYHYEEVMAKWKI